MADLFKALKPNTRLSKNGFDLSRKHVFSAQAGMALPCLSVETVPGDYFEIDLASLSRTQTFNTAAFLRGKQRFDFFFVPYTQLWHPFNQFITQRDDIHSTRQLGHIFAPVVQLSDIIRFLYSCIYNPDGTTEVRKDFMGYNFVDNAVRLLDLLGYGDYRWLLKEDRIQPSDLEDILSAYEGKYVNVFRLAAYQHIWYDYYRNKFYDCNESGDVETYGKILPFNNYVSGFNFDDVLCTTFPNSNIFAFANTFLWNGNIPDNLSTRRMYSLLKLNYIQWKKDIFTTAMPSQQFGAVSTVDLSSVNIVNNNPLPSGNYSAGVNFSSGHLDVFGQVGSDVWSIPSAFDVLSLRKAEALQQWKQQTLRAGNMTDSNFEAHFGVKPYYEGDENVRYLGSFSSALQVNAVETTAQTDGTGNTKVGDLAATGTIVTNGSKLKVECKDYGIIMCIASYLPESEYSSNALDKANTLYEQFDWFTPEFQNLGLEAVTRKEFNFSGQDTGQNFVIGFAPRYYMYKTAVDKVFGEFKDTESLEGQGMHGSKVANGTLEGWVSPRAELSAVNRHIKTFYVDPTLYNNVMSIYASADQETDYLINNVFFDIKAIRPMSVLGLPQF